MVRRLFAAKLETAEIMVVARKVRAQGRKRGLYGMTVDASAGRMDGPSSGQIKTLVSQLNHGRYSYTGQGMQMVNQKRDG